MSDDQRHSDPQQPIDDLPAAPDAAPSDAEEVRGGAEQRSYTGGNFSLDVGGAMGGYLKKIGGIQLP